MTRATLAVLVLSACTAGREPAPGLSDQIEQMLTASAAAWNRGDLDAFLSDYARDSQTGFVSDGHVHYGFEWIKANYAPSFAPGAARDSLRFEGVATRPLASGYALVTARFVLFNRDSVTASGPFTLVVHNANGRWRIIHDHTSRDPVQDP